MGFEKWTIYSCIGNRWPQSERVTILYFNGSYYGGSLGPFVSHFWWRYISISHFQFLISRDAVHAVIFGNHTQVIER